MLQKVYDYLTEIGVDVFALPIIGRILQLYRDWLNRHGDF